MANLLCDGDIKDLAEQINVVFCDICKDMEPLTSDDCFTQGKDMSVPDKFIVEPYQVEKCLSRIKINKAMGPDGIPNRILQENSVLLAEPVCNLWNASYRDGHVPALWKSADVCPLPKVKPPKRMDKDLRPISLTPVLCKGSEYFVREWMMDIIKDFIDPHQFGSLPGSCTSYALIESLHQWLACLETPGKAIRVLLLDYKKAFDLVDHKTLLMKMAKAGLPNFLLQWCQSFLQDRQQRIKIGNVTSSWSHVRSGVPQGTLLGPVCFILHINDLKTDCKHIKYVDDSILWECCSCTGEDSIMQTSADQAVHWTLENKMTLHCDKIHEAIIYFGHKPHNLKPIIMGGKEVHQVTTFKSLGLIFNDKLTWHDHIDAICSKASQRIFSIILLRRAGRPPKDLVDIYCSTIRSVLEYAAEVWHPGLTKHQSECLEHIQKRILKIVYPDLDYECAMSISGLETLYIRRENICRSFFKKICRDDHKLHYLLPKPTNIKTRSKNEYQMPLVKTERNKNSPINYCLFRFQEF